VYTIKKTSMDPAIPARPLVPFSVTKNEAPNKKLKITEQNHLKAALDGRRGTNSVSSSNRRILNRVSQRCL